MTSNLHPFVSTQENLSVPAISRIVSHLILKMLPEAQLERVDAARVQEQLRAGEEVREGLVVDDLLVHSLAESHLHRLALTLLEFSREEPRVDALDLVVAHVALVVRVDEVLDFRLEELADSQETGSRRDLVTERKADLRGGEGHAVPVVVEQPLEVDEDALRGLGAQEPGGVAGGADLRREHQVEREGLGELVASAGSFDFEHFELLAELLRRVGVRLGLDGEEFGALLLGHGTRLDHFVDVLLQELVGAEAVAFLNVFDHEVSKLSDVSRRLEDLVRGNAHGGDFEHVFVDYEMPPPEVKELVLER
mmetsp:Transcript_7192/g.13408  ORF Transcript_7192/g.13408 Transcript_7192/m.13408 type:complete len:308 (-) Transcript_7192:294-1217(-)